MLQFTEKFFHTCSIILFPCLPSSCPTSCTPRTREKNVINLVGGRNGKLNLLHLVFNQKHEYIFGGGEVKISIKKCDRTKKTWHEMLAACLFLLNQWMSLKPGYLSGYNIMVPSLSFLIFQNQSEFSV